MYDLDHDYILDEIIHRYQINMYRQIYIYDQSNDENE